MKALRRLLLSLLLSICLLAPFSSARATLLPYETMEVPPSAPSFTMAGQASEYVVAAADAAQVFQSPSKNAKILMLLRPDISIGVAPQGRQAEGYVCVQMPKSGLGYIPSDQVMPASEDQIPAYTVDIGCAQYGYIYASARGNGHIMLLIQNGKKKHQLLLPNDGQWHAMLLSLGSGHYQATLYESGLQDEAVRDLFTVDIGEVTPPDEQTLALMSDLHTEVAAFPQIVALAKDLTKDAATDAEKLTLLRDYLVQHSAYDTEHAKSIQYTKIPNPAAFLEGGDGLGICSDFASFMAIACRGLGIPCKHVYGINPRTKREHAWNLVWLDGQWHLIDITHERCSNVTKMQIKSPKAYIPKRRYWDGFQ